MKTKYVFLLAALAAILCSPMQAQNKNKSGSRMYRYSTTVEKEKPELNEQTKALISAYRRNPTQENYDALKAQVTVNYDKVIERKKAKLEELRRTARDAYKIEEMEKIVEETINDREHRIAQSMARFTDERMRPGAKRNVEGFVPLIGAGKDVSIAYTPVTNEEYAMFDSNFKYPSGKERHPVVNVSYNDALDYCRWKGEQDGKSYRLPTEEEWELAAGHMPKDAEFNCRVEDDTTPVDKYENTKGASGAIDFWGNCWEWTSTRIIAQTGREKGMEVNEIKGGSWYAPRTSCRTENRGEGRNPNYEYKTVGFRIVKVGR